SPFTVDSGGILGGIGTCGPIIALAGQITPGTTGPGSTAGILNVSGNVTLTNLTTLTIDIFGTNAGVNYDQLNVAGGINLGNCALSLNAFGLATTPGTALTIVANDG